MRRELALAEGDSYYLVLDVDAGTLRLMLKGATLRESRLMGADLGEPRARIAREQQPLDLYATWTAGSLYPPRINVREEVVPPPMAGAPTAPAATPALEHAEQGEFLEGSAAPAPRPATPPAVVEEVEIPKTPEELYPVPLSYEIRFAEGLTLEVVRSKEPAPTPVVATGNSAAGAPVAGDDPEPYPTPPAPSWWERLQRAARQATLVRPEGERVRLRLELDSLEADRLFRSLPPDVKLLIRRPASAA